MIITILKSVRDLAVRACFKASLLWVSPKCKNTITRHCGVANELSRFPKNSFPKFYDQASVVKLLIFGKKKKSGNRFLGFKALERTLNVGKTV